jgi:hypothetical protein
VLSKGPGRGQKSPVYSLGASFSVRCPGLTRQDLFCVFPGLRSALRSRPAQSTLGIGHVLSRPLEGLLSKTKRHLGRGPMLPLGQLNPIRKAENTKKVVLSVIHFLDM